MKMHEENTKMLQYISNELQRLVAWKSATQLKCDGRTDRGGIDQLFAQLVSHLSKHLHKIVNDPENGEVTHGVAYHYQNFRSGMKDSMAKGFGLDWEKLEANLPEDAKEQEDTEKKKDPAENLMMKVFKPRNFEPESNLTNER